MSGDLKWNKIFGAALGTAFVILVVQQASGLVYHSEAPEKMGYFVDAPDDFIGSGQRCGVGQLDGHRRQAFVASRGGDAHLARQGPRQFPHDPHDHRR